MVDAIRTHAEEIARVAAELAEHLASTDELLPLPSAQALVSLETIRADLARVTDGLMAHAAPRRERPAGTK
jgi:hypothetical protein